ncbi:GspH/FimT family pseudopilin [Pseudomonas gingeri]|uniref:Type II secretion system protein H n=1 Tax=Pseudomonas gingeri TaxID=117681 RepID=A0A7Y7YBW8_9PSED|nr:GspH/FimT family protein [Pseudomonas gingeri]NWB25391.1 GspH/FimT family protein [Pseudomonas gingeri]NWC33432.1 GspH/FimT family protein [Pseudomonas gingeri]NWD52141.1 GspH/FimT family protein [Pseudomonas gingeri]
MHQRGLSLVELLVVLVTITVLMKFAGPSLSDLIASQRHQTSAEQLAKGLQTARTEAILRSQNVIIHAINDDWSQGWRIILDLSGQGPEDLNNPTLIERQDSSHGPIVGNQHVKRFVRFSSIGVPTNEGVAGGTLHICARQHPISHHRVVLARTGRIRLEAGDKQEALCGAPGSEQRANA